MRRKKEYVQSYRRSEKSALIGERIEMRVCEKERDKLKNEMLQKQTTSHMLKGIPHVRSAIRNNECEERYQSTRKFFHTIFVHNSERKGRLRGLNVSETSTQILYVNPR